MGGDGPTRTPALTARFADEFNLPFLPLDATAAVFERVREACRAAGRDPDSLVLSAAQVLCCGKDDAELRRRKAALGPEESEFAKSRLAGWPAGRLAGSPAELADQIGRWAEIGATRLYLQPFDLADLGQLELVAAEVLPQVAE
jgi:alkanesulfonate monooxygenase SsuD/methylene tetrahydromethanopterin reductase-like flavin-dependent oxidoreductase (luciferase family)